MAKEEKENQGTDSNIHFPGQKRVSPAGASVSWPPQQTPLYLWASGRLHVDSVLPRRLANSLYLVTVLPREQNYLASVKASVSILLMKRAALK